MREIEPKVAVRVLKEVLDGIDWDQQNASCYSIGEDAAESVLAVLGFDWDQGVSNESVEKFLKELK